MKFLLCCILCTNYFASVHLISRTVRFSAKPAVHVIAHIAKFLL